jgi:large subunit ribosomal protein L44e
MKIPKVKNRYCPKCRKHTEHKVIVEKSGSRRGTLGKGRRKLYTMKHGYGGFPYPNPQKSQRWGVKLSKKVNLKFTCSKCKKSHLQKRGKRAKKVERT